MSVDLREVYIWTGTECLIGSAMAQEDYLALTERCGIDRGIALMHWVFATPDRGVTHVSPAGASAPKNVRLQVRTIQEGK
jgi:hypothetical protein